MTSVKRPEEFDELLRAAKLTPGAAQGAPLASAPPPRTFVLPPRTTITETVPPEPSQRAFDFGPAVRPLSEPVPAPATPDVALTPQMQALARRAEAVFFGPSRAHVAGRPSGRVLLVGRDRAVAGPVEAVLLNARFGVRRVDDAERAAAELADAPVALVVADAAVVDGAALARLQQLRPGVPILLVAGEPTAPTHRAHVAGLGDAGFETVAPGESLLAAVERLVAHEATPD